MPKTGGQLIAESLDRNQVKNVFCVPGESYLGALDALFDKKKNINIIVSKSGNTLETITNHNLISLKEKNKNLFITETKDSF